MVGGMVTQGRAQRRSTPRWSESSAYNTDVAVIGAAGISCEAASRTSTTQEGPASHPRRGALDKPERIIVRPTAPSSGDVAMTHGGPVTDVSDDRPPNPSADTG